MELILIGTLASLIAGLATVAGSFFVLFLKKVSDKFIDTCMGFAAGVMLSVTFFGLLLPAIEIGGIWKTIAGVLFGTFFLILMETVIPHIHNVAGVKGPTTHLSRVTLLMLAITIHNFPEGISVGVGFAHSHIRAGVILAIGIGIQNIIEGFVSSVTLLRNKYGVLKAFLIGSFTCVVEPVGGFLGITIVSLAKSLVPYGLGFAAGAMLFVTTQEIIPETHSRGNTRNATLGLIFGFILMMLLEHIFVFSK